MSTKNAAYSKGNVSTLRYAAAALAFASQLAYLWSLPGEFVIRPLVGAFVLLAAIFQGLLAVSLLFGPGRWMLRFGILLNATIAFVWVVTRFWGFPAAVGFARAASGGAARPGDNGSGGCAHRVACPAPQEPKQGG